MDETTDGSLATCPECGAPKVEGFNCWEQLGWVIGWEWNDPALQREHFLTVASYNLQHPAQFTDDVIEGLRVALVDRLGHGTADIELRRRASRVYEGKKRVLRPEAERKPVLRRWSMTIADVYIPDKPEGADGRVRAWATSIRNEL